MSTRLVWRCYILLCGLMYISGSIGVSSQLAQQMATQNRQHFFRRSHPLMVTAMTFLNTLAVCPQAYGVLLG